MDLAQRRVIIRKIIESWSRLRSIRPDDPMRFYVACDDATGNYVLLVAGWERARRTHAAVLHFRLEPTGKITVEANTTDVNMVQELIDAGVPAEDIIRGTRVPIEQILPQRAA